MKPQILIRFRILFLLLIFSPSLLNGQRGLTTGIVSDEPDESISRILVSQSGIKNETSTPNIILVVVDDLGYGDISAYNPDSKIATPNIDRLASQGVMFTDGHTSASQCSPTRYGIMTGRYSWRTRLNTGDLPHFDEPLIEEGRITIASLLKSKGDATLGGGKWHLGLGWQPIEGEQIDYRSWAGIQNQIIDYSKPLTSSPNNYGFDYYFGLNASNNIDSVIIVNQTLTSLLMSTKVITHESVAIPASGTAELYFSFTFTWRYR